MYLELQEKEAFEEIKAFSLTLNFDSKEDLSEEPVFKFGSDFKGRRYQFMKNGTMRKIKP